MRLPLLLSAGILLAALLSCPPCRANLSPRGPVPGARQAPEQQPQPLDLLQAPQQPQQPQAPPLLFRMGEEYFLRLGHLPKSPGAPLAPAGSPLAGGGSSSSSAKEAAANFFRMLLLQLQPPRRTLDIPARLVQHGSGAAPRGRQEAPERERRSEEAPISLDLTFHLLREVLEMARAEQLAQQAHSNRKLMEIIGK
ncbi:corticoliberin [Suncus etruscus]|uniref:corticoliberin n=1 Tax=Suncus etruscus TaxID=109475 RepID=UPI0021102BA7|nr:corticoliberin [Suncus etruscus]